MCNELELELCQLDDIIEDYLTVFHTLICKDFNFCHNRGTIVFSVLSDIIYQTIR